MSYFDEAVERYRFMPSVQGSLVVHTLGYWGQDVTITEIDDNPLVRFRDTFELIVRFLDPKSFFEFHSTSKVTQYCLNKVNVYRSQITYKPDVTCSLTESSVYAVFLNNRKVQSLNLSMCPKNGDFFVSYISKNIKHLDKLEVLDLSGPKAAVVPQIAGHWLMVNEFYESRSDDEILQQDSVGGIPAHQLLKSLCSLPSLKKLSLQNQFTSNYRLRDIFKKRLEDIDVSL